MKKDYTCSIVFILLITLLIQLKTNAQNNSGIIYENYDSLSYLKFIDTVESQTKFKFFYIEDWIDTIIISQKKSPDSLKKILSNSFQNSKFQFYIDWDNNVIITNNYIINDILSEYFKNRQSQTDKDEEVIGTYAFIESADDKKNGKHNGEIIIGNPVNRYKNTEAIISGTITELETGQPIIGGVIYIKELGLGTISDINGYYVISLPRGKHTILFKYVGRRDKTENVLVNDNGNLDIELEEEIYQLRDVVITAEKEHNVEGLQLGLNKLEIKNIKQIPSSLGEVDVVKTAILLPGVQTVGEGASGFNVRGGSTDQNLILLDESPIFNTSHMFGFFSVFNPDVIKDFKLYKSGVPAKYGGRISSVFDVAVKNGNKKEFGGNGGISPFTGRLTLEGPILNNKASFIVSGRRTYSDWILKRIEKANLYNSSAKFYDVNAKFNYDFDNKNSISASIYHSKDFFQLNSDTTYNYQNINSTVSYKHFFSKKIYGVFSGIYSRYAYHIDHESNPYEAFNLNYDIEYKEFKSVFAYFPNINHTVNFGFNLIKYELNPGNMTPIGDKSLIGEKELDSENSIENAIFINDEIKISNKLSIDAGFRFSSFFALGPGEIYDYNNNTPRTTAYRLDTLIYDKNKIIKTYGGPEFRFSTRLKTSPTSSIKASYNRMRQYLHMLSNTTAISPTDIWKASDAYIPPQVGDQYAFGVFKNFLSNTVETSVEVYYKSIKDIIGYKGGSDFLLNENIETILLSGLGKAYGVEIMIKKKTGRLNGWISYTYSSSQNKFDSKYLEERINDGEFYPSDYDKPHDLTIVSNLRYSRRFSFSNNFTYSTGRPVTYPVAKYIVQEKELLHYTLRNEYRIPNYLRWDLSFNIEGNLKSQKLAHSSWAFSVYNVTGRKNVYSVYFVSNAKGNVNGYKLSIFARPIFTITYNFKF
ncbi:carboxypeptidase-like regulatory domain-containing protein [Bacteroidota bacterium]